MLACKTTLNSIIRKLAVVMAVFYALATYGVAQATTAAGTRIQAQSLAIFEDDAGNEYNIQSNIARVEVKQVYSAILGYDVSKEGLSGAVVSFPFVLTNAGNGTDTYALTLSNDTGDSGDFSNLEIYHDTNDNGVADQGETVLTSISLGMSEQASLVVSGTTPTAAVGANYVVTLAVSGTAGGVTDVSNNGGADGTDGTVQGSFTVANTAIVNVINDTVLDAVAQTVTQTITVTNVGSSDAYDVVIWVSNTLDNTEPFNGKQLWRRPVHVSESTVGLNDPNDAQARYVDDYFSRQGGESGVDIGYDFNGDGDLDDLDEHDLRLDADLTHFPVLSRWASHSRAFTWAVDSVLPAGQTVSMTVVRRYDELNRETHDGRVYDSVGGLLMPTQGHVSWDTDDDGDRFNEKLASSNISVDTIPQTASVLIRSSDTGAGPLNDGGDDNETESFTAAVDKVNAGEASLHTFLVTNTGNGWDTFDLNIVHKELLDNAASVPPGTSFSLWNATNTSPLLDTDGDGVVDTGRLAPNDVATVIVRAQFPQAFTTSTRAMFFITASSDEVSVPEVTAHVLHGYWVDQNSGDIRNKFAIGSVLEIVESTANLASGVNFTGFNPNPPASGPGSCGTGDAFTSLLDAKTVSIKGRYCFDLGNGEFLADVDTAEGGGWVMVLQYIHQGGTDPAQTVIGATSDLPLTSSASLGADESADTLRWGHTGNAAIQQFFDAGTTDIETRWYGINSDNDRIIHFYSTVGDACMRNASSNFAGIENDFTPLTYHTGYLPAASNPSVAFECAPDYAYNHPMGVVLYNDIPSIQWNIADGSKWYADNGNTGSSSSTHHRVWIRDTATPVTTTADAGVAISSVVDADIGTIVTFPVQILNSTPTADTYSLGSGASYLSNIVGAMHTGWTAEFKDASGVPVTLTSLVPAGGEWIGSLEITIASDIDLAVTSHTPDSAIDDEGTLTLDANYDGDFDYPIFVQAMGVNSGATFTTLNVIDINPAGSVGITGGGQKQVKPGGTVVFDHVIKNSSNTNDAISVSVTSSEADWTAAVFIDNSGDGVADHPLGAMVVSDPFYYVDVSGNTVADAVNADGRLPLPAGASLSVTVRGYAPTYALEGQSTSLTLAANYQGGSETARHIDIADIGDSQLTLAKTASIDAGCANAATSDLGPDAAFTEAAASAAPGDCIIVQMIGTNAGLSPIIGLAFDDTVPAFTAYRSGTLRACVGDAGLTLTSACSFVTLTDAIGDDSGEISDGVLTFDFAQGSAPLLTDGILEPGQSVTIRFANKVE